MVSAPLIPFIVVFSEKKRASLLFRLGIKNRVEAKKTGNKRIWIHALSVGEVKSAQPFVCGLKDKYNDLDIVFTVSTKAGFDMAVQLFERPGILQSNHLGYFPFDIGFSIKKKIEKISPDAVCLIETDLWPNFIFELKKRGIPVVLLNARLSLRSLKGYRGFYSFSSRFFSSLSAILVQTEQDERRFRQLGVKKDKLSRIGNIKFDQFHETLGSSERENMKARFYIEDKTLLCLAGSTHDGEERYLLKSYRLLKKQFPDLRMMIAPRDPKRSHSLGSLCISLQLNAIEITRLDKSSRFSDVIIVNTIGHLSKLYAICDVAFIGGSMVNQGGHNPLEAAAHSKPILYGKDMSDFSLISELLLENKGARQILSQEEMTFELGHLLSSKALRKKMGELNFQVFSQHSGAVLRTIGELEKLAIV